MFKYQSYPILFFLIISSTGFSQQEPNGLVNWLTFKEAQEKNKVVERPIIVDIYTDWCGWCKHMMKTTYSNPNIASYINTHFYAVKFDAETKDTIEYEGKIYKPLSKDPKTPHELAIKFLGNSLSYPSTVFITNKFQYNLLSQGYLDEKKIEPLLVFMVENAWRTTAYDVFNKHFQHAFYDTAFPKISVKQNSIRDLESLQKKKAKKVLVNMSTGFCNTGKVMSLTTFIDTSIAAYINKNFYYVDFDVSQTDTILFRKEKYYQVLVNNYPFHSLALKLSNNRFVLPTLCVLDEQLNLIEAFNFYQSPEQLKPVVKYFGSNALKKQSYMDFIKDDGKKPNSVKPK